MAKNTKQANTTPATDAGGPDAGGPDPWADAMGQLPAELLAQLTEKDTAAGSTFPPYWTPAEGKAFIGNVVDVDARNPEFVRYTFLAAHDVVCHRGEVDDQEEIKVGPGERFSVSAYFSLPLDEYMGLGNVAILVTGKTKLKNGNTMWLWEVRLSPVQKAQLAGIRQAKHAAALAANGASKALEDKMFAGQQAPAAPASAAS